MKHVEIVCECSEPDVIARFDLPVSADSLLDVNDRLPGASGLRRELAQFRNSPHESLHANLKHGACGARVSVRWDKLLSVIQTLAENDIAQISIDGLRSVTISQGRYRRSHWEALA